MRTFTAGELARMQATQETAMQDECQILDRTTPDEDDYGLPEEEFGSPTTVACGFDPTTKNEALDDTEVSMVDAKLRLPLSAESSLSNVDRITITKRFGETLSIQPVFEIIGAPERGPSGLVLNLRLVTDGS